MQRQCLGVAAKVSSTLSKADDADDRGKLRTPQAGAAKARLDTVSRVGVQLDPAVTKNCADGAVGLGPELVLWRKTKGAPARAHQLRGRRRSKGRRSGSWRNRLSQL